MAIFYRLMDTRARALSRAFPDESYLWPGRDATSSGSHRQISERGRRRDVEFSRVRIFTAIAIISPRIEPCLSRSPPPTLRRQTYAN